MRPLSNSRPMEFASRDARTALRSAKRAMALWPNVTTPSPPGPTSTTSPLNTLVPCWSEVPRTMAPSLGPAEPTISAAKAGGGQASTPTTTAVIRWRRPIENRTPQRAPPGTGRGGIHPVIHATRGLRAVNEWSARCPERVTPAGAQPRMSQPPGVAFPVQPGLDGPDVSPRHPAQQSPGPRPDGPRQDQSEANPIGPEGFSSSHRGPSLE